MPTEKILIVDDDAAILFLCRRILEPAGYTVVEAKRADDALDKLAAENFDLLLTDIRLPGLTGLDITERLRAQGQDLTVVTMTGYSNMEMAIQALSLGVDEFIVKPFTPDSLRLTIQRALEKSRLRRENTRLRALVPFFENVRVFTTASTPEELHNKIVRAAAKTISSQSIALVLLDNASQTLRVAAACGGDIELHVGEVARVSDMPDPDCLNGYSVHFWRGDELVRHIPFDFGLTHEHVVNCAPLRTRNKQLGLLLAMKRPQGQQVAQSDGEAMGIIAGQAATAIENAHLLEEMSRAYVNLQGLDRLKTEFINIAAHELRTPLSVLMGYAYLLGDKLEGEDSDQMNLVIENAERLRRVVDDMLSLHYLETGRADLNLETFLVEDAVRAITEAYRPLASDRGQTIQLSCDEKLGTVTADRSMLDLMLGNLLSNAIKFSPRASRIVVQVRNGEAEVILCVRDEGQGVPLAEFERIFEAFYQVEDSLTRSHGGLGLGLTITRDMVRAHHGRIWVESNAERGSVFIIALPRDPGAVSELQRDYPELTSSAPRHANY